MTKDTNVINFLVVRYPFANNTSHRTVDSYTRSAYVYSTIVTDYCILCLVVCISIGIAIAIHILLCSVTPGSFLSRPCTFPFPISKNEDIFKGREGMLYRTVNPSYVLEFSHTCIQLVQTLISTFLS